MNGPKPKRYPWSWALLPQDGRFHLFILTVTLGQKTLLVYSGIGDSERVSELTNEALELMADRAAGKDVFIDLRKGMKPELRVRSAFADAEDKGSVLFLSPDDPACADVVQVILKGKKVEQVA